MEIEFACRHDVPDISALARVALPFFPDLHDPASFSEFRRYGQGLHPKDNVLAVLRDSGSGALGGFVWADAALWWDHGIDEPIWCINAIAVAAAHRGQGHGHALVNLVAALAQEAGVRQLFGVSVPAAVPFWQAVGMHVASEGEDLVADRPVLTRDREAHPKVLGMSAPDRGFVALLSPPESGPAFVPESWLSRPAQ